MAEHSAHLVLPISLSVKQSVQVRVKKQHPTHHNIPDCVVVLNRENPTQSQRVQPFLPSLIYIALKHI